MCDKKLDVKGIKCPMPIVEISKAVKNMSSGQKLRVEADDPAFTEDVKAWCRITGHTLDSVKHENKISIAIICLK